MSDPPLWLAADLVDGIEPAFVVNERTPFVPVFDIAPCKGEVGIGAVIPGQQQPVAINPPAPGLIALSDTTEVADRIAADIAVLIGVEELTVAAQVHTPVDGQTGFSLYSTIARTLHDNIWEFQIKLYNNQDPFTNPLCTFDRVKTKSRYWFVHTCVRALTEHTPLRTYTVNAMTLEKTNKATQFSLYIYGTNFDYFNKILRLFFTAFDKAGGNL